MFYSPIDSHTLNSSLSAAVTLTLPSGANGILIQALTQNVRMKLEGVPTASQGFQIKAGDPAVLIPLGSADSIQVIEETASATIQYQAVAVQW